MIVVADAGPIHYLVLIGTVDVLEPLYSRVLVPESVARELRNVSASSVVREWIAEPPEYCETRPDPPPDRTLEYLGAGQQAAITLALSLNAERLLIDDQAGRQEAARRELIVTGTLGVLAEAHRARLLNFEAALTRLRQTSFYVSKEVIARVRQGI
jgi:predicted nucleic acid-binding protein